MSAVHTAWLGLGANLGDPPARLVAALGRLAATEGVQAVSASRLWRGPYRGAWGPQPEYFNLCARVRTRLDAHALLALARALELAAGRRPAVHEAPRVLDIDLLLFDTLCLDEAGLTLPHPRLRERRFVLEPLADLDPDLPLPPDGVRVRELLLRPEIATQELELVASPSISGPAGYGSGT